mgnify:CR=1 FL=1
MHPGTLIPVAYAGIAGSISFSARIPGVHVDREPTLRGRSVVLHAGPYVDSPLPGTCLNNYIACGVFRKAGTQPYRTPEPVEPTRRTRS